VRSDFLDRAAEDQGFFAELTQGLFFLAPPNREALRDAIVKPAELAGFRFELPSTVEDMLGHLETTPGALPLLQFTAAKLWEHRDQTRKLLSHHSYTMLGGVTGALASHADKVVNEIGAHKQPIARAILLRLVTPERTRAIVPIDELRAFSREAGEVQRLVDHMVDARLLVVQTLDAGKGSTVEIVHESLIHNWPTLRRWLDETQEDAALVDQLRVAARQWHKMGRSADLLWRGETADEAKKFRKRYKAPLSDIENAFLDEVIRYEVALQQRRRNAVVAGFTGLGVLVIAAMVALVVIQKSREESKRQAKLAEQAQGVAEQHLRELQDKEQQRQKAETEKQQAQTEIVEVKHESEEELRKKNLQLSAALEETQKNEQLAKSEATLAQQNADRAQKAQAEAESRRNEVVDKEKTIEDMLRHEQDRRKKLEQQIGSPIVDELK
jgi:hypothetical protein